jgi:hypothetical protein
MSMFQFAHHFNGFLTHQIGLSSGAENSKVVTAILAQQTFSHLAARRIASAED